MNQDNSDEDYLLLREILNEVLIRDVILFIVLFTFILAQSWDHFFLLLFPIISFSFSLFFRIISTNKWRVGIDHELVQYNPMGSEKRHANRLFFCSLFLLILLYWICTEVLMHPQFLNDYVKYFQILFVLIYTFGFWWILIDAWKYTSIKIRDNEINLILKSLGSSTYKKLSIISLILFISLNMINVIIIYLIDLGFISGISFLIPEIGIGNPFSIYLIVYFFIVLILSPSLCIGILYIMAKNLKILDLNEINEKLDAISPEKKEVLITNLKMLNKRIDRKNQHE